MYADGLKGGSAVAHSFYVAEDSQRFIYLRKCQKAERSAIVLLTALPF